jgi:hypothetical protein
MPKLVDDGEKYGRVIFPIEMVKLDRERPTAVMVSVVLPMTQTPTAGVQVVFADTAKDAGSVRVSAV